MKVELADVVKVFPLCFLHDGDLRIAHKASLLAPSLPTLLALGRVLTNNVPSQSRRDHSPDRYGQQILGIKESNGCGETVLQKAKDKLRMHCQIEPAPKSRLSPTGLVERSIGYINCCCQIRP
jgi:hypothetical protein